MCKAVASIMKHEPDKVQIWRKEWKKDCLCLYMLPSTVMGLGEEQRAQEMEQPGSEIGVRIGSGSMLKQAAGEHSKPA